MQPVLLPKPAALNLLAQALAVRLVLPAKLVARLLVMRGAHREPLHVLLLPAPIIAVLVGRVAVITLLAV
jgi:hypothetical protein